MFGRGGTRQVGPIGTTTADIRKTLRLGCLSQTILFLNRIPGPRHWNRILKTLPLAASTCH